MSGQFGMRYESWITFCPLTFCKNRHKLGCNRWFITKTQTNNVLNMFKIDSIMLLWQLCSASCSGIQTPFVLSFFCPFVPLSLGYFLHPRWLVTTSTFQAIGRKKGHAFSFRMQPKVSQINSAHITLTVIS